MSATGPVVDMCTCPGPAGTEHDPNCPEYLRIMRDAALAEGWDPVRAVEDALPHYDTAGWQGIRQLKEERRQAQRRKPLTTALADAWRDWRAQPEVIGKDECPILHRWTVLRTGRMVDDPSDPGHLVSSGPKLFVHHFLPETRDRHAHNHPRPFWTLVLRGGYVNVEYDASGREVRREEMRPGMFRLRRSTHLHKTFAGPDGCWTLVLMGPVRRPWGFVKDGVFYGWRQYEALFGKAMKCDEEAGL